MVEYVREALRSLPGPPGTASYKPCSFSSHPPNQAGVRSPAGEVPGITAVAVTC